MIIDKSLGFSNAQVNVLAQATYDSTNIVDLGMTALAGSTFGDADGGQQLNLYVNSDSAATSGGAATLVIKLVTATDVAFTTPVTLFTSATYTLAQLAAGTLLQLVVPRGFLRFLKLTYTVGTADLTASSFTASMTPVVDTAEAAILQHD